MSVIAYSLSNCSRKIEKNFNICASNANRNKDKCDLLSKHSAVIISGGKVISTGINYSRGKMSILDHNNVCAVHAEMDALSRLLRRRRSCSYSLVKTKEKGPCLLCA